MPTINLIYNMSFHVLKWLLYISISEFILNLFNIDYKHTSISIFLFYMNERKETSIWKMKMLLPKPLLFISLMSPLTLNKKTHIKLNKWWCSIICVFKHFFFFFSLRSFFPANAIDCFKCVSLNGGNPACDDPFHVSINDSKLYCVGFFF